MTYKVTTKSGKIYRASEIDINGPYLKMTCWDGEHRIPNSEVTYIKSTEVDVIYERILPVALFVFVFTFAVLVLFY